MMPTFPPLPLPEGMVVLYHPDCPGGGDAGKKHIGYWDDSDTAWEASPDHRTYESLGRVLPKPQDFVDPDWDPQERAAVVQYLEDGEECQYWRGYSWCRMCSHNTNGTTDRTDWEWIWPDGFAHYVETHDVKPPAEFIQKVLGCPR